MRRAIDRARAMNEDLERMRRGARALVAELERIADALRPAEGRDDEPHRLDATAREISVGPGSMVIGPARGPGDPRGRHDGRPGMAPLI